MITFSSRIDLDSYEEYGKQTTVSLKNQKFEFFFFVNPMMLSYHYTFTETVKIKPLTLN